MARVVLVLLIALAVGAVYGLFFRSPELTGAAIPSDADAVERGRYLVAAGGCISCHQGTEDSGHLSGGLALESPFGVFHVPNITPDAETGIGGWEAADFLLAMKHGRRPDGSHYYPAFPYPAYAGLTDNDVLDMAAYLLSQEPVVNATAAHELPPWLKRWTIAGWNWLAGIGKAPLAEETDPQLARGAYLARHLGHCGECHSPRNELGILDPAREFGGGVLPDGKVEAIDPEALADWTADDMLLLLNLGLKPDGDFVGGKMEPVIEHNTSQLTLADKQALSAFLTGR